MPENVVLLVPFHLYSLNTAHLKDTNLIHSRRLMDKHLDFRLAWLSGWAFSWDVFLLVEQRALLWLRLFHAAHGRDAEVPLEAAVLRGCLVAAWPRSQSTRPCSLPGSLPPSEADPRASAVENDNLLIPVHCPGGPFDQGSAVAASF